MKITVVGTGYVGLSLAILIARFHKVIALDIDEKRIESINNKVSPLEDDLIKDFLSKENLHLNATNDESIAYTEADMVIICTPTNYDVKTNEFDVSAVTSVIEDVIRHNKLCSIFVKSTVPVGFTDKCRIKYAKNNIIFSPEFLREGQALRDNLRPSRIVVGDNSESALTFADLLKEITDNDYDPPVELMNSREAEAVKLFANTYLAMRISYFNELDTFCEINALDTKKVIEGISHDLRIGHYYNNPSFGYGGYCLPKDTQQLLKNYDGVPNNIINAVVEANNTRKNFISNQIIKKKVDVIGFHKLVMKDGSDNFRESAILGIIERINNNNSKIIIYEPLIQENFFMGFQVINDLNTFKEKCNLIVSNRMSKDLYDVKDKVYTRDIFGIN